MNYKLFSNPGKKIKTISIILFWVLTVSSIICAVSFGWVERHGYYSHFFWLGQLLRTCHLFYFMDTVN